MSDRDAAIDAAEVSEGEGETWLRVGPISELERRQRLLVEAEPDDIVVWWHGGCPHALRNVCVHDERALADGSLLGNRVVCPGHQWAFDVATGYCTERDRYQPVYETRIEDGEVFVSVRPSEPPPGA